MWRPLILILLVIFIGVTGFHIIEDWPLFDSLYMTVITIFTVGFKEVRDLSPLGRFFTIFIILGGVGTVLFAFTKAAEIVFEGGMRKFWRRRKMENHQIRNANAVKISLKLSGFLTNPACIAGVPVFPFRILRLNADKQNCNSTFRKQDFYQADLYAWNDRVFGVLNTHDISGVCSIALLVWK